MHGFVISSFQQLLTRSRSCERMLPSLVDQLMYAARPGSLETNFTI
jgi:hypothetical protein